MNYYYYEEELIGAGMQLGELAIYTGIVLDGLRGGPCTCDHSSNAYVYWREEEGIQELDTRFQDNVLEASVQEDHYVFLRNESGNFIQQVSGPAKPVVMANIGAGAIRVDTPLGKFLIPAGAVLRLDRDAPLQREKKKVLLTFSDEIGCGNGLGSALILEGGRWKPLNICADNGLVKIEDGAFTIQTLTPDGGSYLSLSVTLKDPPLDSDHEIYLRSTAAPWFRVRFAGVGMKDEGLARVHHTFRLEQNEIYDFQRLRQTPATELMRQCTAHLPGLEELDGRPEDGETEGTLANGPALRGLLDPVPDCADASDTK